MSVDTSQALTIPRHLGAGARMRLFRRCLEALAEPGTVRQLDAPQQPADDGVPVAAAPVLALSDLMCPLAAATGDDRAASEVAAIAAQTHAPQVALGEARFVLALAEPQPGVLTALGRGTLARPHEAALLFVQVDAVTDGDLTVRLTGPGIDGERTAAVSGLSRAFFTERDEVIDYPLGVDLVLITPAGTVLGLPRSTKIEVIA